MSEGFEVKGIKPAGIQTDCPHRALISRYCLLLEDKDTEEVERPGHIDDGVSRLRLRSRGKLDDLLGRLEELRHSRPWTVGFRTLEHKKCHINIQKSILNAL